MLKAAVTNCFQPVKIFISYWQIAGNMGVVLHFQFPPYLGNIIAVFKPLVAAVHGVVALECAGLTGGFYVAWMFEVLVVPCILWGCVLLYFFSRVATVGRAEAAAKAYNEAFFVLFLTYPVICNKLFKMLDCRHLSEDEHVRLPNAKGSSFGRSSDSPAVCFTPLCAQPFKPLTLVCAIFH